eukprot:6459825-Amphidinium_carterae.1
MDWHWIVNTSSLTDHERWAALGAAAAKALTAKHPWRSVFGPAGATLLTLVRLGLRMDAPGVIAQGGLTYDLRKEGEYRLRDLAVELTTQWGWHMHRVRDGQAPLHAPCYEPVARAMRQLEGKPLAQYGLAATLSHGVWTPESLSRRSEASSECVHCGRFGDLNHRLWECERWRRSRERHLSPDTREWVQGQPPHVRLLLQWQPSMAIADSRVWAWRAAEHDPSTRSVIYTD